MKKFLLSLLLLVAVCGLAFGQALSPYPFPFTGKWNPSENPLLIDDYGFQDVQNVRKDGKRFKGVNGHTAVNTVTVSGASNTYPYILDGFHFRKDQPAESHIIVYAGDSMTPTAGRLYRNTTAVPGTGNFSGTALYTPVYYNDLWSFSAAPGGNMIAANGDETLVWGGNEIEATSFITSADSVLYTVTNGNDYSTVLNNTRQTSGQVATLSDAGGNDSYVKLLLHMDGAHGAASFTDDSASGHTVTPVNTTTSTAAKKFGTASAYLPGPLSAPYLTLSDSSDWSLGSNAFTVDFWVYFGSLPASGEGMGLWQQYQDANNFIQAYIWNLSGTYSLVLRYSTGGVVTTLVSANWTPSLSNWYHIAFIRGWSGIANQFVATVDGTYVSGSTTAATIPEFAGPLTIGIRGTANYLNGYIDEFRFSNGIARWTANFTKPTQAYGNASNYFLVGSKRPLQGVKFYVSSGNTVASTLTAK